MFNDRYTKLQQLLGISFNDLDLLDLAFVHKSYLNEHKTLKLNHNERLEFLGDAVLEMVTTEFLYINYPNEEEGNLTAWRSALVKGEHLASVSTKLELGVYLYLSRGEERTGGRRKNYLLANALEALIGAIYLDQGYLVAKAFIQTHILQNLDEILKSKNHLNAKSTLQEICQEKHSLTPTYKLISEIGPDHQKNFTMGVYFGTKKIAEGSGPNKQAAEQNAAAAALQSLNWIN